MATFDFTIFVIIKIEESKNWFKDFLKQKSFDSKVCQTLVIKDDKQSFLTC
jgi:hypothetical protein